MADVFRPQTIPDVPIPVLNTTILNDTVSAASSPTVEDASPNVIQNTIITPAPVAVDVIGVSMDTQNRRILGEFQFGQVGAIKVGTYEFGVSGQILISPNGITGINVNGTTVFAIDNTTGNATFLGTIQAGSFIAGDSNVVIDGTSTGGRIVILTAGVPSIVIGNQ